MPDRDAIRARCDHIAADILRGNHDPRFVSAAIATLAAGYEDLLAALDKAEGERARLKLSLMAMERLYGQDAAHLKAMCEEADALEARADAAERRGERMLAAVVAASHTVIPDHGAEWMNGFAAGQRAMRAALARAASGGNATRTGDPRPDGSREP